MPLSKAGLTNLGYNYFGHSCGGPTIGVLANMWGCLANDTKEQLWDDKRGNGAREESREGQKLKGEGEVLMGACMVAQGVAKGYATKETKEGPIRPRRESGE